MRVVGSDDALVPIVAQGIYFRKRKGGNTWDEHMLPLHENPYCTVGVRDAAPLYKRKVFSILATQLQL